MDGRRQRGSGLLGDGRVPSTAVYFSDRAKLQERSAWLGFDIATGIFGDPALGAKGNTATEPGSLKIRDGLSAAGQRGFNASVALHLSRNYRK